MRKIRYLTVKNGKFYKDATLRLDTGRILLVTGRNENSSRHQSNAAGKSLFFAYLYLALYGQPPLAANSLRGNRRQMMSEDTELEVGVDVADDHYVVRTSLKKTQVLKNGVDLGLRTQSLADSYVKEHVWPMPAEFFAGCCYLSSQLGFTFQRATDSQRLAYIEQLFKLDGYDQMYRWFKSRLKELSKQQGSYEAYADQHLRLKAALEAHRAEEPEGADPTEISRLGAQLSALQQEAEAIVAWRQAATAYKAARSLAPESLPDDPGPALKKAEAQQTAWEEGQRLRAQYRELRRALPEAVEAPSFEEKNLKQAQEQYERAEAAEKARKLAARYERGRALAEKLGPDLHPKLQDARRHLALAETSAGAEPGTCPLCGGPHDSEENWEDVAEAAACRVAKLELAIKWADASSGIPESPVSLEQARSQLEKQRSLAAAHQQQQATNRERQRLLGRLRQLKQQIREKPEVPPAGLSELRKQAATYRQQVQQWRKLQELREDLRRTPKPENPGKDRLKQVQQQAREIQTRTVRLSDSLARYDQWYSACQKLEAEEQQAATKLKEIKGALRQVPALEALAQAYSNKGIRLYAARTIADQLTEHLNALAPVVYREPLKFQAEIGANAFTLSVTRRGKQTSDVRYMSASESQRLNLLLPLAFSRMLPASSRTPLMILDEMVSNADPVTEQDFTQDFLPRLHQAVPNLVVVTPRPLVVDDAVSVVAVKKGRETRLEGPKRLLTAPK